MSKWNETDYLAHWPMAIPFPYSVKRSTRPVPNSNAVNWPQSQFAPLYLAPGSPSFQPYSYEHNDIPLYMQQPPYQTKNFLPYARSGVGPGGDTSALPASGAPMLTNPRPDALNMRIQAITAELRRLSTLPRVAKVLAREKKLRKVLALLLNKRKKQAVKMAKRRVGRPIVSRSNPAPVVRMGFRPTATVIPTGSPAMDNRQRGDLNGYGDGFAYELAPLQAAAPYGDLGGDCGCGCYGAPGGCKARTNGSQEEGSGNFLGFALGAAILGSFLVLPTFVIEPWIIKRYIKPEWSYGNRVLASFAFNVISAPITAPIIGLTTAAVMAAVLPKKEEEEEKAPSITGRASRQAQIPATETPAV